MTKSSILKITICSYVGTVSVHTCLTYNSVKTETFLQNVHMKFYHCLQVQLLWLLYYVGNYMQMMHVLKPIASDVLECLTQLFDYYLYAVS